MNLSTAYALSVEHYRRGDTRQATDLCVALLSDNQQHSGAFNLLGLMLLDKQQYTEAAAMFEKAIDLAPDTVEYLNNLGAVYEEQQQYTLAECYFRQALALNPKQPETLTNLANVLQIQQAFSEAKDCYRQALQLQPQNTRVLINLGICMEVSGENLPAAECYQKVLSYEPHHPIALNNLGNFCERQGHYAVAINLYQQALQVMPQQLITYNNLGIALMQSGEYAQAIEAFQTAIRLNPVYTEALRNLGDVYAYQGFTAEASHYYQQALQLAELPGLKIRLATLLPVINASTASISQLRQQLAQALNQLSTDETLSVSDPVLEVRDAFFYLAYHGLNNRDLKTQLANLLLKACPSLKWTAPHCTANPVINQPIKVGILSKYFYQHSIGKTTQGLFAQLPRERFKVFAILIPPVREDPISQFITEQADAVLVTDYRLTLARQQIAALELDVLYYTDIGMDPFSYYLSFARLAHVQCTSFGHPETSGVPNVDYYISSRLFETDLADRHYSEKLHLLHNHAIPAYYYRPALPSLLKSRQVFGFSEQQHLYLCPQTSFKFHPDFDAILAGILERDAQAEIILLSGPVRHFAELLAQRLQNSMPGVMDRVTFLPAQSAADFINLIAIADVMLDIPSFNGMNSTLEAFAVGTPVVTMPGELQCSRHTAGLYRKMGINSCIASTRTEYLDIALKIGNSSAYRQQLSTAILDMAGQLFADQTVITAFSDFFEQSLAARPSFASH